MVLVLDLVLMSTIRNLPELTEKVYVCVFVCVRAHGMRHCFSLAAICKVNVVENNIHLPTHPSQNSFISRSTLTRLLIVLSNVTCIILSVSDTINKVFKSLLLPSYLSSVYI